MAENNKKEKEQKMVAVETVSFNDKAFTIAPLNNSWAVVEVQLNAQEGKVGPNVRVIETNTERLILQERLQVILMQEGIL